MSNEDNYQNPLTHRYASSEMSANWSPRKKFGTWRSLWVALAETQQELGLEITDEQIEQMRRNVDNLNLERAEEIEQDLRHDVMSHIRAFAEQCPQASPVIHLGATSCFVTDNSELIQLRDGLQILTGKLEKLINALRSFSLEYKDLPTLGFTHFQPAQLTTVGKRASLWLYDFALDLEELRSLHNELPFRGAKGTTGTQASFLELFEGNEENVQELDRRIAEKMGFNHAVPVCGQTYTRKFDHKILSTLSGIAQSAAKMCNDIRLLAHMNELQEPFGRKQVGSSAMAYKQNPMRSERVCSLARYVVSLYTNAAETHSHQWLERTLDDSANRRLSLPQAFLGTDAILSLLSTITSGIQVWPRVIEQNIRRELPFMATENILMSCTKAGGDRQSLHEAIRTHALAAKKRMKEEGAENDLLDRIRGDARFAAIHDCLDEIVAPEKFTGRAAEQAEEFVSAYIDPLLAEADTDEEETDEQ